MELAQALILTNALGALSSLGLSSDSRIAPNGGHLARLGDFEVEAICCDTGFKIFLHPTTLGDLDPEHFLAFKMESPLVEEAFLPGRVLLQSKQGLRSTELKQERDHLSATMVVPDGRFLISIELTLAGKLQRTPFIPIDHSVLMHE